MVKIFKRDLSALRREVLAETSKAAATLARLRSDRANALLEADGLATVTRIDYEIDALETAVAVHQERLKALSDQLKAERHAEREQNRTDTIRRIAPLLSGREKIAAELEVCIQRMSELWFALAEFPSPTHAHWPFPLQPGFGKFDLGDINREMSLALYSAARPVQGRLRMPTAGSLDSGVTGRGSDGLQAVVARQNAALLSALQTAPLGHDESEPESNAA
jgi:hypothetical protein